MQIEDWIREIEKRPASAPQILRAIGARLAELDRWNEELLADNIALRSGSRVEEYESRIAALEYQLELLKRGVENAAEPARQPAAARTVAPQDSLLLFNPGGQVLRVPFPGGLAAGGQELARFAGAPDPALPPGLLAASEHEELLFVFDSGRTVTLPAGQIRAGADLDPLALDWRAAHRVLPRPGEELAAVLPITGLPLAEYCVQASRRGCAKLMPRAAFQSALARGSIGAGIKRRPDRPALLALCGRDDGLVLVTREGSLVTLPVSRLPYSVEEVLSLSISDYIVAGFPFSGQAELIFITNGGKAVRRDAAWLEPAGSFKSRGQAVFSSARREAGTRLVGAAALPAGESRCAALRSDGGVWGWPVATLLESGALDPGPAAGELLAFTLRAGRA